MHTSEGPISICGPCPPGCFKDLKLDAGLGTFAHYSSIIQKLEVFEKVALSKDGRVALALIEGATVIGYVTCAYPGPEERWSKLGELMYELAAIEVSRNFRHMQIGQAMLGALFGDAFFEDKITYMNGFSWHWDLDGTGLTMSQYRQVMMRLVKGFGFQECYTNEPNIAMREENLFMARTGSRVSEDDQKRFRNLRFGIVNQGGS
ncbi:MAG: N-acetyltransferase [Desulfomonile tiedjei]|nr:N-acetyltransferase [Desulfomonile tiedjei]